jgi:hypothetical protein
MRSPTEPDRPVIPGHHLATSTDGLVPAAFEFPHTASHAALADDGAYGSTDFTRWVSLTITRLLALPFPTGGYVALSVVVESASGLRLRWDDTACAEPGWLADRVRPEAVMLEDPWLLGVDATRAPRGCVAFDDQRQTYLPCLDATSAELHRHASWYAEARGRGVAKVLAGGAFLEPTVTGGDVRLALRERDINDVGPAIAYRRVLRAHPARRAHRLR